jgi:hypothetical protein
VRLRLRMDWIRQMSRHLAESPIVRLETPGLEYEKSSKRPSNDEVEI